MSDHKHLSAHIGRCPTTGKKQFWDRQSAKTIARFVHQHVRPYRCEHCGFWHNGHLAPSVLRGLRTRAETYQRKAG